MESYVINVKSSRITPLFAGHEACAPSHSFGPYVRDCYLIHFCIGGKGVIKNESGIHSVNAGSFFVIRPGEVTTYTADSVNPWEYLWIAFRADGEEYFTDGRAVYDTPSGIDDRLASLLQRDHLSNEGCLGIIYDLLYQISENDDRCSGDERIRRIRRYIKYNYMLPISVSSLAHDFGFERSYLYRIFKSKYGVGVKEYISSVRLEKAEQFLKDGYNVKESAAMVGYEDEFNFSKAFKAKYGVSPSKISSRKKEKGESEMKYVIDHDYHLHSMLSQCSSNPEQTPSRLIEYAKEKGLGRIILTDHFWDESVPGASNWYSTYHKYTDISKWLPLPKDDEVELLFGCETDMDKNGVIGISRERCDDFDFIIVSTTHMHMKGFTIDEADFGNVEALARLWVERFDALLSSDLPFHKIGLAHPTSICIAVENGMHYEVIRAIPDGELVRLFTRAAELGMGIEINGCDFRFPEEYTKTVTRPYRIAKECGCKFYLGTDAHKPSEFSAYEGLVRAVELLGLTEEDKFHLRKR